MKEDEWPNFEFYPCITNNTIKPEITKKLFLNGQMKPFRYTMNAGEILASICPGEEILKLELNYKKKPMPLVSVAVNGALPTVFNPYAQPAPLSANFPAYNPYAPRPPPIMPGMPNPMYQ